MNDEKIKVRVTASGQTLDVVVLNKRLDKIEIVLGEGVHNVRCDLVPTRNGSAYVGNAMGREIVYERSREEVKADLARAEARWCSAWRSAGRTPASPSGGAYGIRSARACVTRRPRKDVALSTAYFPPVL